MHSTDLCAEALAKVDADLSPEPFDKLRAGERRREIAAILDERLVCPLGALKLRDGAVELVLPLT